MVTWLEDALERVGSNDAVAREILREWPSGRKTMKPRSLGTKVGQLKKGDTSWWGNHEAALSVLAKLVGRPADDLLFAATAVPEAIRSVEFPALRSVELGDPPCLLDSRGWLGHLASPVGREGMRWIVAPPGSGKQLATRWLELELGLATARKATLRRAVDAVGAATRAVVRIEAPLPVAEVPSELELRRSYLCVLATFPPPPHQQFWEKVDYKPEPGWRRSFLRWVLERVESAPEHLVEEIEDWLEEEDPTCSEIATPGAALPWIRWAYEHGVPTGLTDSARVRAKLLEGYAARAAGLAEDPVLRRAGKAALDRSLTRRFEALETPCEPLAVSTWAALMAEEGASTTEQQARLEAMVHAGMLAYSSRDRVDVAHRWVDTAAVAPMVDRAVRKTVGSWARWALDFTRRDQVDAALDRLSNRKLLDVVKRVGADDSPAVLQLAARESAFAAVGRRLVETGWAGPSAVGDVEVLRELGAHVLTAWRRRSHPGWMKRLAATTRRSPRPDDDAYRRWVAYAWGFAEVVPCPDASPDGGWFMPGWSPSPTLDDAVEALSPLGEPCPRDEAQWTTITRVARHTLARCSAEVEEANVPRLLLPWMALDRREDGSTWPHWLWRERMFKGIAESTWTYLGWACSKAKQLKLGALPTDEQLVDLLRHCAAARGSVMGALMVLEQHGGMLADAILAAVSEEELAVMLAEEVLVPESTLPMLAALPETLRRVVLERVVDQIEGVRQHLLPSWGELQAIIGDDTDLLVRLSRCPAYALKAAALVWEMAPEVAQQEAESGLAAEGNGGYAWFKTATSAGRHLLLSQVLAEPQKIPPWLERWLYDALVRYPTEAERIYSVLDIAHHQP